MTSGCKLNNIHQIDDVFLSDSEGKLKELLNKVVDECMKNVIVRKWNTWLQAKETDQYVSYTLGKSKMDKCKNFTIWIV